MVGGRVDAKLGSDSNAADPSFQRLEALLFRDARGHSQPDETRAGDCEAAGTAGGESSVQVLIQKMVRGKKRCGDDTASARSQVGRAQAAAGSRAAGAGA